MRKVAVLFLILLVPSIAYLILSTGKHKIKPLQYFGAKSVSSEGDTIYKTVPPFQFTDQDGKPYGDANLKNKIYVANFFFTSCPTICPKMQTLVKKLHDQDDFKTLEDLKIISFTVDPDNDTPQRLKEFENEVHADGNRWKFLTGNRDSIYNLAFKGFMANAMPDSAAPGGFLHSDLVFLIDRDKHIRGIYEGTNSLEMKRLIDETKVLIAEYNLALKKNVNPLH
ncbi:MAG: SCO family protein [Bacteroidia bacterium]|jgi:protein SCO1/2